MKKNPNQIADEELLKLLENLDETEEEIKVGFDSSVLAFVQAFNLKPGKDRISKKQLYKLYKLWNKGVKKLTQKSFTIELSYYLDHINNFFLLDQSLVTVGSFVQEQKNKNKQDKTKSKYWHTHFQAFLNDTKLEEGSNYIELEIIYFIYQLWRRKTKKKTDISRLNFTKILDLYFDLRHVSSNSHLWVGVNDQIKNLITKSEVERWRKTRGKSKKAGFKPQEEWRQFALYWEEKEKSSL